MCHLCPGCAQALRAWLLIPQGFPAPRGAQSTLVSCTFHHPGPPQMLTVQLSSPGSFSLAFPLGKAAEPTAVWCDRGSLSTDRAQPGLVRVQGVGRRQRRHESGTGTACFHPERRRSSSTVGVSRHRNGLTCLDQSAACVQQLNFTEMVKPVPINPDPNQVFFITEATA